MGIILASVMFLQAHNSEEEDEDWGDEREEGTACIWVCDGVCGGFDVLQREATHKNMISPSSAHLQTLPAPQVCMCVAQMVYR